MSLLKSHIQNQPSNHKPNIIVANDSVVVRCAQECKECQFSIADELGRIQQKGFINDEKTISLDGLNPGFYHLIIFNEFERYTYPIKLE